MFLVSRIRIHYSEVQIHLRILLFSHKCVERTEIMRANKNLTKNLYQIKFFRLMLCLWASYKKKIIFFLHKINTRSWIRIQSRIRIP
jgi:hypothetical protein